MKDLLSNIGAGGGAPVGGAPAAGAASGGAPAAEAPKEEEKKEEEKEESDDDMVRYRYLSGSHECDSHISRLTGLRSLRLISSLLFLSGSPACSCICTALPPAITTFPALYPYIIHRNPKYIAFKSPALSHMAMKA